MPTDPAAAARELDALRRAAFDHHRAGRSADAESAARRALAVGGEHGPTLCLLGATAMAGRRPAEACDLLARATRAMPADAAAWNTYGVALVAASRAAAAEEAFGAAARLQPDLVDARLNLGRLLATTGRPETAAEAYRAASRYRPDDPHAWAGLLAMLRRLSDLPGCLEAHRQLARLRPGDARNRGMLLTALLHDDDCTPEAFAGAAREQARAIVAIADGGGDGEGVVPAPHAAAEGPRIGRAAPAANPPTVHVGAGRRLRIGYLGPAFRRYTAARFLAPVLAGHDRDAVEVVLYSDVPASAEDDATAEFRRMGFAWRPVAGLGDEQVAARIRADGVDVLVDLAGHMDSGRLPLLARRAAPVQVNYLAWPATTGLAAVDYRVTDSHSDPPGTTEHLHAERLVRVDPCCWAYDPAFGTPGGLPPVVERRGRDPVTFAAFNRLIKVTPRVLGLWRRVLDETPGSRLIAIAGAKGAEASARRRFADAGFPPGRVEVLTPMPRPEFLRRLGAADVLLDTYPYHGMTTTCDALFLGVPVVTLAGRSHVSRVGVSLLNAVGLGELVAERDEAYVRTAVDLAADAARRVQASLRDRVLRCPIAQGQALARRLEAAFRQMIRT